VGRVSALDRIGVRVEGALPVPLSAAGPAGGLGNAVGALAFEIAASLEHLHATGEAGMIDLRSLPMTAADRSRLQQLLGHGEVAAVLEAEGTSTIRETAVPGVWWSEYRNAGGALLAEIVEVCRIPDILVPTHEQLAMSAGLLRSRLAAHAARTAHAAHAVQATHGTGADHDE
jgi:hydrogenase-1 operon protein HyaF